mmetsp:Transcript_34394/g.75087  ORF Transcript_34394/g.75087 Transcript_34394/m.75087 type:complete len:242 (-) Transcript_34394:179-904(-)|eukprot:CAMPEP_0116912740 /NCGR_PEP_ID=MMETSP0467-20121206/16274_1 /TAXON_ID=283647 /ORGANISM="Mesodinium pulex, Strain SPMC105" /LENGTH=241 /DNA_ID=CAMNT_0004588793 /DNA_START=1811 /DNA_END=2536 /DNA_ORIENTATION=-
METKGSFVVDSEDLIFECRLVNHFVNFEQIDFRVVCLVVQILDAGEHVVKSVEHPVAIVLLDALVDFLDDVLEYLVFVVLELAVDADVTLVDTQVADVLDLQLEVGDVLVVNHGVAHVLDEVVQERNALLVVVLQLVVHLHYLLVLDVQVVAETVEVDFVLELLLRPVPPRLVFEQLQIEVFEFLLPLHRLLEELSFLAYHRICAQFGYIVDAREELLQLAVLPLVVQTEFDQIFSGQNFV